MSGFSGTPSLVHLVQDGSAYLQPVSITANTTVSPTNIASVYGAVQNVAGLVILTIPSPLVAKYAKFRVYLQTAVANAGADFQITSVANSLVGAIVAPGANPAAVANSTTLEFPGNVATVGSYVDFYSDGAKWQVLGVSSVAGGITAA